MVEPQDNRPVARVRMWRWRRNPLRRRSDRVEAWVLLVAWVLALVGGIAAGVTAGSAAERGFDHQRTERREVQATVVKDDRGSDQGASASRGGEERAWAPVRWTGPDGEERRGRAQVEPGTRAGARVPVWTDRSGALASAPLSPSEALLEASLLGAMATGFTCGTVWVLACGARGALDRRRMEQWDEEWRRVDSRWGRTAG